MNRVNIAKKNEIKRRIVENPNKPITEILRDMKAKPSIVHRSSNNKCVQVCLDEIRKELREKDVNVELIIHNLNEDRNLAAQKGDIATMTRVDELLGKYLAMFKEVSRSKVDMDITEDRRKELDELVRTYGRASDRLTP
jgi:hypothetical protein